MPLYGIPYSGTPDSVANSMSQVSRDSPSHLDGSCKECRMNFIDFLAEK